LIVKYLLIILLYIQFATQIGDYLQLITDSGEFYLKYNGVSDNEFRYSFFAEVGLADDFGENIYIPFHMLTSGLMSTKKKSDTRAPVATPSSSSTHFN
jgi:hypothetical protein